MIYEIAKKELDHEVQSEEKTVDILLDVCDKTGFQFKRILEAASNDGGDLKRIRMYAEDGVLYTSTCTRKYARLGSSAPSMPEPLELPPAVQGSSDRTVTPSPLRTIDPSPKKSDMEWTKENEEELRKVKGRMNWRECFDEGRAQGYFKNFVNANSLIHWTSTEKSVVG